MASPLGLDSLRASARLMAARGNEPTGSGVKVVSVGHEHSIQYSSAVNADQVRA